MARRKYSDQEKAEAIAAVKSNGGNIFRTAQELKIPWATLADWVKNTHGINHGVTELREEKEQELASLCESVARKYLNQAGNEYVVFATPGNLAMTAAGIAIDKAQLLRGQPTEITSTYNRRSVLELELKRLQSKHAHDPLAYNQSVAQLRQLFTDQSDPAYDEHLDYTKHPENWPDIKPQDTVADTGSDNN